MPQQPIRKFRLKITYLKFHSNFPWANELIRYLRYGCSIPLTLSIFQPPTGNIYPESTTQKNRVPIDMVGLHQNNFKESFIIMLAFHFYNSNVSFLAKLPCSQLSYVPFVWLWWLQYYLCGSLKIWYRSEMPVVRPLQKYVYCPIPWQTSTFVNACKYFIRFVTHNAFIVVNNWRI